MNYQESIQRVCEYIQLNLDEVSDIEIVYQISGFSKFHFHRIFTAFTGISVSKFIGLCRFKRASYQLAFQSDKSILEIALEAGFESHEVFTRFFKRIQGQTPSEFRNHPHWQNWHENFNYQLPRKKLEMNVEIISRNLEKIAYISHQGDPKKVLETAKKFIKWRESTYVSAVNNCRTYGIPYSDPKQSEIEHFRFDIASSIVQDLENSGSDVKQGTIPAGRFAKLRHVGSHDQLEEMVYYLYRQWLPENGEFAGEFPVFFQYHNFIYEVEEQDLITDILLLLK